jgi:hypothetical protein
MEKPMRVIVLFSSVIILLASCQKNAAPASKSVLTLSGSTIKRGEPLIVTTNESRSELVVKWSVNPSTPNTWISPSGIRSVFLFSNPGSFSITASYFADSNATTPYDSSSSPITVTDSLFADSSAHCNVIVQIPVVLGDQIFLTPISYSDTGLVLLAHTQHIYDNHYPMLSYGTGTDSTAGYEFDFGTVNEFPCGNSTSAPTPAMAILTIKGLNQGTQDLTVFLNDTMYKGSLTVTQTECSFSWSYSSGVTLFPLTIQKQ